MPQDLSHDIASIREWLAKETYLAQDFDDTMIKKFLHSCYGSLERTKKCIERFCVTRSNMPEIYTDRDPTSARLKTAFSITNVTTYKAGENEVLIHKLTDPNLDKYSFYDLLKAFTIQADHWLKAVDFYPEGHLIVFDLQNISLRLIPRTNIMYFRDFLLFLLEGMPVRVKQVHAVNSPSYYDKLYSLVKPVLPQDIRELIYFHTNSEALHKFIDKQYLPVEYGGEAESMQVQHDGWVRYYEENKEWFINENRWKADLKKKPKSSVVENTMSGSFRTLSID